MRVACFREGERLKCFFLNAFRSERLLFSDFSLSEAVILILFMYCYSIY